MCQKLLFLHHAHPSHANPAHFASIRLCGPPRLLITDNHILKTIWIYPIIYYNVLIYMLYVMYILYAAYSCHIMNDFQLSITLYIIFVLPLYIATVHLMSSSSNPKLFGRSQAFWLWNPLGRKHPNHGSPLPMLAARKDWRGGDSSGFVL